MGTKSFSIKTGSIDNWVPQQRGIDRGVKEIIITDKVSAIDIHSQTDGERFVDFTPEGNAYRIQASSGFIVQLV
jgi:hypothetical protein